MKRTMLIAGLLALAALWGSCGEKNPESTSQIHNLDQFKTEFADPSTEYRTMTFFVWNSDTKKSDIDRALASFKANGIGGGFIHPRMGMITDYLSEDWWDLVRYTLDKGKEMGLEIWLYDENGFPSGQGGGIVQHDMPDSYAKGHSLVMERYDVLPPLPPKLEDPGYNDLVWEVILKGENGKYVDITARAADEVGKKGDYYVFKKAYHVSSPRWGGYPYVNMLMPGVTEKFIEITMPGYEKTIGEEFGKMVPGIFTDEPHIRPTTGATWFTDIFERYQQRWGYDLRPELPKLFDEVGDDWRKIRHNYRQFLMEMQEERWTKPWREYCDAHNLKWTGHYWEHEWPNPHVSPDYIMMESYFDIPGIDILFNQYNETHHKGQFGNVRSPREIQSLADQMGNPRTVVELYAGSGWELSFFDMKRQADWVNVLGINMITQHYSPVSVKGIRKVDYPQVFSYQMPWWDQYGHLGEYHARMSVAMSAGDHYNDILVLRPTTSAWMYYIRGENKVGYRIGEIANPFQALVTELQKNQVGYDMGSEAVIEEYGSATGKNLVVGKRAYRTVVVPSTMENINTSTFELLKSFVANGGQLIVFGEGPAYLEGAAAKEELGALFNQPQVVKVPELNLAVINQYFRDDTIRFADDVADKGRLYHQSRVMDDGQIVLLTNTGMERISGEFTVVGADALKMDAMTGVITDYPEVKEGGRITVKYDLYPADNLLLYVTDKKQRGFEPTPFYDQMTAVAGSAVKVQRDEENVLVIDYLDQTLNGKLTRDINAYAADDKAFQSVGFKEGNPWFFSAQYNRQFVDHPIPANSSLSNAYHFTVADDFDYSGMSAVIERADSWKITINGHEVKAEPGQWWVDVDFNVVKIGPYVRKGKNMITLSVAPINVHSETVPIYIRGDFSVNATPAGWVIGQPAGEMTLGSWKAQAMPFYGRSVTYTKTFEVPEGGSHYEVELDDWNGTVAEVTVNGQSAGIIGWPPYRADVSKYIQQGVNTVDVKVIGSYKNLFGNFYVKARGQVSPSLMKRAPEHQPKPDTYDLFDYGLMGDFQLLQQ